MQKAILTDGKKAVNLCTASDLETFLTTGAANVKLTPYTSYASVAVVFRAVRLRAGAVQAFPFVLRNAAGADLLTTPDPDLLRLTRGFRLRLWQAEASLCLYGVNYLLKATNARGRNVTPMWALPATMEINADNTGLTGFTRTVRNTATGAETKLKLKPDQVVYTWLPALNAEIGPDIAPAAVALQNAGILKSGYNFIQNTFDRGGVKATILFVDESKIAMRRDEYPQLENRFARFIDQLRRGVRSAFEPLALDAGVDVKEFGSNMEEADIGNLTTDQKQEIADAFGIPYSLLFSDAANYATAERDVLNFYNSIVIPSAELLCETWNEQLFQPEGLTLEPHPERLEVMQSMQLSQAQAVLPLYAGGLLSKAEAREMLGYTPEETTAAEAEAEVLATASQAANEAKGLAELRRWDSVVARRWAEGKPHKALAFTSEDLAPGLCAAIVAGLEAAEDVAAARAVIRSAIDWWGYP